MAETIAQITLKEGQQYWINWCTSEITKHEKDIQQAEGKVNELKEMRNQITHQCEFCGEYLYWYRETEKENKVLEHLQSHHADAYTIRLAERKERIKAFLEAHPD